MSIQGTNNNNPYYDASTSTEGEGEYKAVKSVRTQFVHDIIEHAGPEIAGILQLVLPPDFKSWEMKGNEFTLELEKSRKGTLEKVDFAVNKVIKGKVENGALHFQDGCITGTYFITGSLMTLKAIPSPIKGDLPKISATGGKKIGFLPPITHTVEAGVIQVTDLAVKIEWKD